MTTKLMVAVLFGLMSGAAIINYRVEACRNDSPSRTCVVWIDGGGVRLYAMETVVGEVVKKVEEHQQ